MWKWMIGIWLFMLNMRRVLRDKKCIRSLYRFIYFLRGWIFRKFSLCWLMMVFCVWKFLCLKLWRFLRREWFLLNIWRKSKFEKFVKIIIILFYKDVFKVFVIFLFFVFFVVRNFVIDYVLLIYMIVFMLMLIFWYCE